MAKTVMAKIVQDILVNPFLKIKLELISISVLSESKCPTMNILDLVGIIRLIRPILSSLDFVLTGNIVRLGLSIPKLSKN